MESFSLRDFWLEAVGERIFGTLNTRLNERLWNLRLFCTQQKVVLAVCDVLQGGLALFSWLLGLGTLRPAGKAILICLDKD
jgi:hypothetical protein